MSKVKIPYIESAPVDNWQHRSTEMLCSTCMWFIGKKPEVDYDGQICKIKLGRCRKHAPTLNGFPAVYDTDWCGDHKIR